MSKRTSRRLNISAAIISFYLVTVVLLSVFPQKSWGTLLFGLFLGSIGSVATFLLLRQWERTQLRRVQKAKAAEVSPPANLTDPFHSKENFQELESSLAEYRTKVKEQIEELNQKKEEIHHLTKEQKQFDHRVEDVQHEFNTHRTNSEEEIRRKTVLLSEYQETINQQREVIKKKQDQISELESKVHDLNYEVKTLLQLAEIENSSSMTPHEGKIVSEKAQSYQVTPEPEPDRYSSVLNYKIRTPEEAFMQLKRCIDIAQKITGSNRFGNGGSRFRDMPIDNYALDLRRLFDSLGSESSSTVIVYSLKEKRLLFANDQTKNLLGWNGDKFIQNFSEIIQEGEEEWKRGISNLSSSSHSSLRLLLKTKTGHNLLVHCHLGSIPTGVFRNHVIGVLFPA